MRCTCDDFMDDPCQVHASPVEYLPREEFLIPEAGSGYTVPGWYFWEETWAYCQGPFPTKELAQEALEKYCREQL